MPYPEACGSAGTSSFGNPALASAGKLGRHGDGGPAACAVYGDSKLCTSHCNRTSRKCGRLSYDKQRIWDDMAIFADDDGHECQQEYGCTFQSGWICGGIVCVSRTVYQYGDLVSEAQGCTCIREKM